MSPHDIVHEQSPDHPVVMEKPNDDVSEHIEDSKTGTPNVVPYDDNRHKRLRRKIDRHLMPLFCWLYLLNYLDRSNIGNAKILNAETGDSFLQTTNMTANDFSIAVTIFSIMYTIFEVPSNWVLKRYVRPSLWLASLLFCWGVLTLAFAFVKSYGAVIGIRTLIGIFEAGFYPGMIYVISFWYRQEERSIRIAYVSASSTFAGAFGGCIAYGTAQLNGDHGIRGWEWLFIIEGSITVACTLLVVLYCVDYPTTAKWLTEEEREFAISRLAEQQSGYTDEPATKAERIETFVGLRMVTHYLTYLTNVIVFQGLVYFCPTIVHGLGFSSVTAQIMTVPPWAVSYVVAIFIAKSADKFNARGYHAAGAAFVSGVAFLACALLPADAFKSRYACLVVACCGVFPSCSPLTAWVSCNAPSARTVGYAVALNNSVSGIASIIGVWIWRSAESDSGYPTGNKVSAICSFVTALLAIGLRLYYGRLNAKNAANGGTGRVWAL